ncbi:TlpA family protein disulfide reductase [Rhizobium bangladeshense]|uniref:TlpA family protein disulfide reductase n=1 Tax=Rhizobium bangladeshense TaxID=1138189 RepID=A0ABS7LP71_9HYPH|nr:TlpA disulfide reductase family protein [Rhizobium bangladeshense]MBX4870971.1 TlpA family protein disulfide reductase [Rhizobium bangladeshense]MBX4876695.1 TlpA family protein disulfide reductase [Rhizobium bangladeshense]MBX4887524.1 TlpA family protein disulfide reductase [Rhizobium bangladeshense]MBX4898390.1 TlpA family protein disulfide reductase [Rhizobium bangladeshense]MBX4904650.1 TlpA family protein disulfide reductase [Rhizobium bangladeshense]
MTTRKPFGLPSVKLIAIAAVAGVVAGAAAVYVKETGIGNGVSDSTSAECSLAKERAANLTPLMKGQVAAMVAAGEPRKLTAVSFNGPDGKAITLDHFAGKTVLLNLWATWCVPCREEMPALNALEKSMGSDKFQVVPVNIDTGDDEKPKAFLNEIGVDALQLYRDNTISVFNSLKKEGLAFGLPVTLLLDDKGCLISAMNGPAAWDSEDAKALIRGAIGS